MRPCAVLPLLLAAAGGLFLPCFSQPTVTFTLTGVGSGANLGGAYISPSLLDRVLQIFRYGVGAVHCSDRLFEPGVELKRLRSEKDDVLKIGVCGIQQIVPLICDDGRWHAQYGGLWIQLLRQIARS